MIDIKTYFVDGAKWQEQAILMCLKGRVMEVIGETFDDKYVFRYHADVKVGRYENCREQGYIFSICYDSRQLMNYAVFEHRNSDRICIIKFRGQFLNTPSVDEVWKDKRDKWDVDKEFGYGSIVETTDYIINDMCDVLYNYIEEQKKEKS